MDLTGLGSVFDFGSKIIERVWPDPAQRAQATLELTKLQQSGELQKLALDTQLLQGQIDINKVEAASSSKFISWWRPAVGWTCVAGLIVEYFIFPLSALFGATLPKVDFSTLMGLLIPILGLGAYRTAEKIKGAEGNR
jgi:hypothetical protein